MARFHTCDPDIHLNGRLWFTDKATIKQEAYFSLG
jgi:hypothetical protein